MRVEFRVYIRKRRKLCFGGVGIGKLSENRAQDIWWQKTQVLHCKHLTCDTDVCLCLFSAFI